MVRPMRNLTGIFCIWAIYAAFWAVLLCIAVSDDGPMIGFFLIWTVVIPIGLLTMPFGNPAVATLILSLLAVCLPAAGTIYGWHKANRSLFFASGTLLITAAGFILFLYLSVSGLADATP